MLILFGSHARGDWVEDAETGYKSDYDFLVVVETEAQVADVMPWGELEQRVRAVIGDTPLTLIVHDVKFVNREIRIGQYFFGDIANEGVALYDSRKFTLAKPKVAALKECEPFLSEWNCAEELAAFWMEQLDAGRSNDGPREHRWSWRISHWSRRLSCWQRGTRGTRRRNRFWYRTGSRGTGRGALSCWRGRNKARLRYGLIGPSRSSA
jgi:predicted nucleotidyltransferase